MRHQRLNRPSKLTIALVSAAACAASAMANVSPAAAALVNGKIAFAREPDTEGAMFTISPNGSDAVQVGTGENLHFSPDGTRLLFACSSADEQHVAVCTVNPDGTRLTRVVPKTGGLSDPPTDFYPTAWSPDGRSLLIDAGAGITTTGAGIFTMRPDGTHLTRVTSTATEQFPVSFSPDGSRILFLDGSDLFVVRTDGTGLIRVNPANLAIGCCPPSAAWSPDGRRIAFTAASSGGGGGSGSALYTVRPDGGGIRRLTPLGISASLPRWSPDGGWIAFESSAGFGWPEIAIVHPDGSDQRFVTSPSDGIAFRPIWSPDGARLAMTYAQFDGKHQAQFDIWTVDPDGTGLVRLTNTPEFDEAQDWGVSPPAG